MAKIPTPIGAFTLVILPHLSYVSNLRQINILQIKMHHLE